MKGRVNGTASVNLDRIIIRPAGGGAKRAGKSPGLFKGEPPAEARRLTALLGRIGGPVALAVLAGPRAGDKKKKEILRLALKLEKRGAAVLSLTARDASLRRIYKALSEADSACRKEPGLWNVVAYEREWDVYPAFNDYLDPASERHALKTFEREIYMGFIGPKLKGLPANARILDAGGGIGRFALPLAKAGYRVDLFDASEKALKTALRRASEENIDRLNCHLGDASELEPLPDAAFDAVLLIEVLCYCTEPETALAAAVRKLKPGGLLFASVEGTFGSLIADPSIELAEAERLIQTGLVQTDNYVFTRYYTRREFVELLERAGLEEVEAHGTHYAVEGPLGRMASEPLLGSREGRKRLKALEAWCGRHPVFSELARSWLCVAKKPESQYA